VKLTLFKFVLFWVALQSAQLTAQEDRFWYFGQQGIGIDFGQCEPQLVQGEHRGFECAAAVSTADGELLFSTNGDFVLDRNHALMQGGEISGIAFDPMFNDPPLLSSLTQVAVAQQPGSNIYFLFTSDLQAGNFADLVATTIDMNANGGLGAVIDQTTLVTAPVSEKMCTVPKVGAAGYWVITHRYNSNQFDVFDVSPTGLNTTPQSFNVGLPHATAVNGLNARGELRASLSGTRLALVQDLTSGALELFDFDPTTGVVSNPQFIENVQHGFGLSFSPNEQLLYLSTWSTTATINNQLIQYNLQLPTAQIAGAKVVVATQNVTTPYGSLKVGPDGRMYLARPTATFLGVIENPDALGLACNYIVNGFSLNGDLPGYGLNNIWEIQPWASEGLPLDLGGAIEACDSTVLAVPDVSNTTYLWSTGETTPSITVTNSGTYSVVVTSAACEQIGEVEVEISPALPLDLGDPVTLCAGESITFTVDNQGVALLWNDGSTGNSYTAVSSQVVTVEALNGACSNAASTVVTVLPVGLPAAFETAPVVCEGTLFAFTAPAGFSAIATGESGEQFEAPVGLSPGMYEAEIANACDTTRFSLQVLEEDCSCPFYVPNAFSPDGDGRNEVFQPAFDCNLTYTLCVFDRWGACIFDSREQNQPFWNGSVQGGSHFAADGVYVWQIERQVDERTSRTELLTGSVVLIR
jgi:gliding motility-associated-like protein